MKIFIYKFNQLSCLTVANGIFIQNDVTIGKYFKEAVQKTYSSEIEALDFRNSPQQASQKINA